MATEKRDGRPCQDGPREFQMSLFDPPSNFTTLEPDSETESETISDKGLAAIEYAERGWPVHPLHNIDMGGKCTCGTPACRSAGKHPRLPDWVKEATTDENLIERRWAEWPNANVGLVTGADSGVDVLDIDNEQEFAAWCNANHLELPPGPIARTGSGGIHRFFRHRPGIKNSVKVIPGADVRSSGGNIVLPPSSNANGTYSWLVPPDDEDLPEWPEYLFDALTKPVQRFEMPPTIEPGTKHTTIFRMMCSMRAKGFGEDELFGAGMAALGRQHPADEDQVPESDIRKLARAVAQYPPGTAPRDRTTSASVVAVASPAGWPERSALQPESGTVPAMTSEMLPESLGAYVADAAERASVPVEMVAVPVLTVLSATVGAVIGIRPGRFDDWTVIPNLWGAIIAAPGAMKSHCVSVGTRLLDPLVERARVRYEDEERQVCETRIRLENEYARLKTKARSQKSSGTEAARMADIDGELKDLEPAERRFLTNDSTVEKIGELLKVSPRGLLVVRDEITGVLRTLDKPGREGDREFLLESWNGNSPFVVDRIGRGTVQIPNLCLSILGGVQPGKMHRYQIDALGNGGRADGLLQRFQLIAYPDGLGTWETPTSRPDHDARKRTEGVLAVLADFEPEAVGATREDGDRHPWVRWCDDAQGLWDSWRKDLETRLRDESLAHCAAFESHAAKYRSLVPTLALLTELVEWADGRGGFDQGGVSLASAHKAIVLVEFFDAHARKLYQAQLDPGPAAAHTLAGKIQSGELENLTPVRTLRRNQWSGLRDFESIRPGLDALVDAGWIRLINLPTSSGRTVLSIELHPDFRKAV